ncbi:hypothetical protein ALC53_02073 [Atta colombica]|uniref:Uncharacterized protein n=1 Tax=Atta colombica TaxID=520822 RepID=A0A195BTK3_9HYME|nr:hypothetical protein ALC53_02073 [Atta colombica]
MVRWLPTQEINRTELDSFRAEEVTEFRGIDTGVPIFVSSVVLTSLRLEWSSREFGRTTSPETSFEGTASSVAYGVVFCEPIWEFEISEGISFLKPFRILLNSPESETPVSIPRPASIETSDLSSRRRRRRSRRERSQLVPVTTRQSERSSALPVEIADASVDQYRPAHTLIARTGWLAGWPKVRDAHRFTRGTAQRKRRSLRRGSREGSRQQFSPTPSSLSPVALEASLGVQTACAEGYFETIKFREITWFLITNTFYYVWSSVQCFNLYTLECVTSI